MTTPLASIIIPAYNQARFLPASIESTLAQTYPRIEVIVVNDGSTDDTAQVLRGYQGRVQVLTQQNAGLAAARNAGLRAAQGEYLLFLDSDDCIPAEKLERHIQLLEAHPEWALVYSAWQQVNEDNSLTLGEMHPNVQGQALEALLLRRFFFFASSAVIRRSCLEKVGVFDENLRWGEDADLWLRLARAGYAFGYLDEPLLQYRVHQGSMTARVSPAQVDCWLSGLEKFFADPHLPAELRALEAQAYSILRFETAGRYLRAGQNEAAQEQLRLALQCWMPEENWLLEWAAGTALDARSLAPEKLVAQIFEALSLSTPSSSAGYFRRLKQHALGRYHAAAAFAALQSGQPQKARPHILPAIAGDVRILSNRGFWRLIWRAWQGR